MKKISKKQAKAQLSKLIQQANNDDQKFAITDNKETKAVLISKLEYDGLLETIEIMSDPELAKGIEQGLEEIRKGNLVDYKEVFKE